MTEKQLGYGSYKGNKVALLSCGIIVMISAIWMIVCICTEAYNSVIYPWIFIVLCYFIALRKNKHLLWLPCEINITDQRVYGSVQNRPFDIPLFELRAVEVSEKNELVLQTQDEKTVLHRIDNASELRSILVDLLEKEKNQSSKLLSTYDVADSVEELKKLKELLDCGAITQEEFDAKKKQLLTL